MELHTITVGNIYNDEKEYVTRASYEDAFQEAHEVAIGMLEELKKQFKKVKNVPYYFPECMTVEDDITFSESVEDAYEYHTKFE